ncbi:MAG: 50S ribosomal protein L23 [Patescibacteria group bacterium]
MRLFNFLKKKAKEEGAPAAKPAVAAARVSEKKETPRASAVSVKKMVTGVLLRPLVTEKGTHLEAQGTYQFAVAPRATKRTIKRAFEMRYGVRPRSVNVMHRLGKTVRFGRTSGHRSDWKRALITVPKGVTINVHEGV